MFLEYNLQACLVLKRVAVFDLCGGSAHHVCERHSYVKCLVTRINWITQNGAPANTNVIYDLEYDKQIRPRKNTPTSCELLLENWTSLYSMYCIHGCILKKLENRFFYLVEETTRVGWDGGIFDPKNKLWRRLMMIGTFICSCCVRTRIGRYYHPYQWGGHCSVFGSEIL